jgi:uncharacterized membrane protein
MSQPVDTRVRTERRLGNLLNAGIMLSALCLIAGLPLTELRRLTSANPAPHPLLHAGLMILMATPIVRVLISLVEEVRARNWFFALVTLAVVGVLSGTLIVAWRAL